MPYEIIKAGRKWKVVKKGTGKTFGTHSTREQAEKQLRAIYANTKE